MRRFTFRLPNISATVTHLVAVKNQQKRNVLHVFVRDATNITRIANWRAGRDAIQKIPYFIHRSICGAANIQLLNLSETCECR